MVDEGRKQRVIPAKAGTHGRPRARGLPWVAAYRRHDVAGMRTWAPVSSLKSPLLPRPQAPVCKARARKPPGAS